MKLLWFVRGDIDGFFGLFIDNLLQLMLIGVLGPAVCGFSPALVEGTILPAVAVSLIIGNIFYAWQARQLAVREGRSDVTALPYGINTPSLFAFIFLVIGPVYHQTGNATLAWQVGLFTCLLSGIMETVGAFVGDWLRRHTPRAALLAALAGVALTFIAMGFIFQIFASPAIALIPMMLILISYASRTKLWWGFPGGLVAVGVGTAIAWGLRALGFFYFEPVLGGDSLGFVLPHPVPKDVFAFLSTGRGWEYLSVIFPMGLFNVIGSLQNLESAEAAGDRLPTRPSLLINGLGTLAGAFFGSPFPTTIYIGHPGWKAIGARTGYSVLNGIAITGLCLTGGISLVLQVIPVEVTLGILLWVGLIITAQAYQEVPKAHALAVTLGLIPPFAAYVLMLIETTARAAGSSLYEVAPKFGSDLFIQGIIALNQGFLVISLVLASVLVFIIEKKFQQAALWSLGAAGLSAVGLIHAFTLTSAGVQNKFGLWSAPEFTWGYLGIAALLYLLHRRQQT